MWSRAPLHRPFEGDEIFSLRRFSSLPYEQNCEAVAKWRAFDLGKAVRGIGKCFLTGYDTGNHLLVTLPGSIAAFFLGFSEWAFRVPSVIAGMGTSLALYYLLRKEGASVLTAWVCAAATIVLPYFYHYGQTARGYSANVLCVLLQIILVQRANPKNAAWTGIALAAISVIMCMNIVTMAIMWLAPLFLALICLGRRKMTGENRIPRERLYWLGVAALAGAFCGIYGLAHLADLVNSQGKWGTRYGSAAEFVRLLRQLWEYFIPVSWTPALVLAAAGVAIAVYHRNWIAVVFIFSAAISLTYICAVHAMPYYRTFGHFMLCIPLGIVWLSRAASKVRSSIIARSLNCALLLILLAPEVLSGRADIIQPLPTESTDVANAIRNRVETQKYQPANTLILAPFDQGEQMRYYFPADAGYFLPDGAKSDLLLLFLPCMMQGNQPALLTEAFDHGRRTLGYWQPGPAWPAQEQADIGQYQMLAYRMHRETGLSTSNMFPRIILWDGIDPYFNPGTYLAHEGPPAAAQVQLLFNYYDYLPEKMLALYVRTPAEEEADEKLLRDLGERTKGNISTLLPETPPTGAPAK